MNPQNISRILSGAGKGIDDVLRTFGRGLVESGILKPVEHTQLRLPLTVPEGAVRHSTGAPIRKGTPWSPTQNPPIPEGTLGSRPSVGATRPATATGQMSIFDIPLARPTTVAPSRQNFLPAPEPQFSAPYRSTSIRPAQVTSGPAPVPQFPSPTRQAPGALETFSQLSARDPGTAKSVLQAADQISAYHGVPREEALRNLLGPNGTEYIAQLERGGAGSLVRSPEAAIAGQDLRPLAGRFAGGGGGEASPSLASSGRGGSIVQSPGGDLSNKNVSIPDSNFYIDVESRTVPPELLNAVGGVRTGNLGALAAVLGGGAAAGLAVGSRLNQGEPSLGDTTTAAPPEPRVPASSANVFDDRVYSTPLPDAYRKDSPYLDPSARNVVQVNGGAGDSAVREQIEQYARGQGTQNTRASKVSALQAQYAQESLKARANIGEIVNELGFNAPDKAPLRQWAVQNPALAMRLFEQQQAAAAQASNLQLRDSFPAPNELAPSDSVNQQSSGNVQGTMINSSLGSNLANNATANSHFGAEAAVNPTQGSYELSAVTEPLEQPTLLTGRQYTEQAPAREYDSAQISNDMLRRALELKLGSSQFQTASPTGF